MEKVYVARVLGSFPEGGQVADVPLAWDSKTNHVSAVPPVAAGADAGEIKKAGLAGARVQAREQPKESVTHFRLLWVAADKKTSLVECR